MCLILKKKINLFKEQCLKKFEKDKEDHTIKYVSAMVNFKNENHFGNKAKNLKDLENEFEKYKSEIKIQKWHEERLNEIDKIIKNKDYKEAIVHYNNKDLLELAKTNLKLTNLENDIYRLLILNDKSGQRIREILLQHFPKEITTY